MTKNINDKILMDLRDKSGMLSDDWYTKVPQEFFNYCNLGDYDIIIDSYQRDRILRLYHIYFSFARDNLSTEKKFVDVEYHQFRPFNIYRDYGDFNEKFLKLYTNHVLRFSISDDNFIRVEILEKIDEGTTMTRNEIILSNGASKKEHALHQTEYNEIDDTIDNMLYYTALRDFNNRSFLHDSLINKTKSDELKNDLLSILGFALWQNSKVHKRVEESISNIDDGTAVISILTNHFSFKVGFLIKLAESGKENAYDIDIIDTQFNQRMTSIKDYEFPEFLHLI